MKWNESNTNIDINLKAKVCNSINYNNNIEKDIT